MEREDVFAAGPEGRVQESGAHVGESSTYDDYFRIEDIDNSGKADAREIRGLVQNSVGQGVAGLGGLEDGLCVDERVLDVGQRGWVAFLDKANGLLAYCSARGQCFPASLLAATTLGPIDHQFDVTDFTCGTSCAPDELTVGYESRSDAGAEGNVCQVLRAQSETDPMFGNGGGVCIVLKGHGQVECFLEQIPEGHSVI